MFLSWGWGPFHRYSHSGIIYRNGKAFEKNGQPVGGKLLVTVFGFGICIYEYQEPNGSWAIGEDRRPVHLWSIGRFRFVRDRPCPSPTQ